MNNEELTRLSGVVERVTFSNSENGYSVLKVAPFAEPNRLVTVVLYQLSVFAGCSMEFFGNFTFHPKHGEQFRAESAIEKKPATTAALEKYLGSGLIKGVGPKTAGKIVQYFKDRTLQIFEDKIEDLVKVPGIAEKKLEDIKTSWGEHKALRDVMLFLQGYGMSTLFAVKIFKTYGNEAINIVSQNPYQLAKDIYGIGFFSADRIALSMGFERDGEARIEAGIRHVLAASRDDGHCFLDKTQICENTLELLQLQDASQIERRLGALLAKNEIKARGEQYYSNTLYYDELYVANRVCMLRGQSINADTQRVRDWVTKYCEQNPTKLSEEQLDSVVGIARSSFAILTGGPGCGKTTTTKVLVRLLKAMKKRVVLAAPTGRAAQRMSEVIGIEAKTIHRLLEVSPGKGSGFKKNEENPLEVDFLIVDECSMLDISLTASLLRALPPAAQLLFIGDPDQLPSVGAGNVLFDLLQTHSVARYCLTKVFRQAEESLIIRFAHQINRGEVPKIESPLHRPALWRENAGCLFIDAEEATKDQIQFLHRVKGVLNRTIDGQTHVVKQGEVLKQKISYEEDQLLIQDFKTDDEIKAPVFIIPEKFKHVDLQQIYSASADLDKLKAIFKSVHPWSALHYGMSALDVVLRLYTKTIPEFFGSGIEIQVLTPQIRGSLGTLSVNQNIQAAVNPHREGVKHLKLGDRVLREGDRVMQIRNNYNLGVYNGDIGSLESIDLLTGQCVVLFGGQSVVYRKEELNEIVLAYGVTIHKSQGSEFEAVIIPVATQHFKMLFRILIYTGLTRAKRLCVFVGSRKALSMAVRQVDSRERQTALTMLIERSNGCS